MNNMPYEYQLSVVILLTFSLGVILAWLIIRPRITEAQKRLSEIESERNELGKQLAVTEQKTERIPILGRELESGQMK
jgi:uncharacterized membrane protein YciS (DUF1049 family)